MLTILLFSLLNQAFAADVPPQFSIEKYADVPNARQMTISPNGTLYVGSMENGSLWAVSPDRKVTKIAEDLNMPNGVAYHEGTLFIAEISKVSKIPDIDKVYAQKPKMISVKDDFPTDKHHGWKHIAIGPDGLLYVPVGAPCNVCNKPLPYAAIHRMTLDGKKLEFVAGGIRNTVGFTWHPETKKLYFTDNGRDYFGEDRPKEEINVVNEIGQNYGFPFIHNEDIKDPIHYKEMPKGYKNTPPLFTIQAHSAALGIKFFPKDKFPKEFHDCFLVAEHGSWNRTKKVGYQVTKGCLKNGKVVDYKPFVSGFLKDEKVTGRPVDILFKNDGSIFISDDEEGKIYLIKFKG